MYRLFYCFFCLWFSSLLSLPTVQELSLEEKIGQLLLIHVRGESLNDSIKQVLAQAHIGGIIYYPFANGLKDLSKTAAFSKSLQEESSIPLFIAIDQEGGRLCPLFSQPSQRDQALLNIHELTKTVGQKLSLTGINLNFSPVVDVDSNPLNPIIGNRSYSKDPYEVIRCAREAIAGYQEANLLCCLKHFPGHGDASVDSHLELPVISKSPKELESMEFVPFKALHSHVDLIMTGHLLIPALDPKYPATLSSKILTELLRKEWGYKGAIISDSLIMRALTKFKPTLKEIALQAFNAGCDILCISGKAADFEPTIEDYLEIHSFLVDAARNGTLSLSRLDESVERILILKARYCQ